MALPHIILFSLIFIVNEDKIISVSANHVDSDSRRDVLPEDTMEMSDESKLTNFLIRRYKSAGNLARPVLNSSHTIEVEFSIALIQILDLDESHQVLSTSIWKRYRWRDELLTWNPSDFGSVTDLRLPASILWTPDIVLYNNAAEQEKRHQELLSISYDGVVKWIPPAIFRSSCPIDMRNFPFDEQTCNLKFGSWTYDGYKLNLSFYDSQADIDTTEYINSSEWEIAGTSAVYAVRNYPCCGEDPFPDLTFYLTIHRRTGFYIYVLVLPSLLLSFLTLVLFWIPPQRPDRTTLGMSLFSSFFVLLLILVQSSPPTSASISLLGLYYCINMVLIALSTMLSSIVINITHHLQKQPVPEIMRRIFLKTFAKLVCARYEESTSGDYHSAPTDDPGQVEDSCNGGAVRKGTKRSNEDEWKLVAVVMDRVFFSIYIVAITISIAVVFPR